MFSKSRTPQITGAKKQSDEVRGAALFSVRVNLPCSAITRNKRSLNTEIPSIPVYYLSLFSLFEPLLVLIPLPMITNQNLISEFRNNPTETILAEFKFK